MSDSTPSAKGHRTRQELVQGGGTPAEAVSPPPTSSTLATGSQTRKDTLAKHGRSHSQSQVAQQSTTTTSTTSGNNSNNSHNSRRHSHTANHAHKTRPMMRSISNQSQHHNHHHQYQQHQQILQMTQQQPTSTSTSTKSERRLKSSTEQQQRKRKPKFVFGDHADEEQVSSNHSSAAHETGATERARGGGGGSARGVVGDAVVTEEEEKEGRVLEHDGYHPSHPPRHKHDPYPVSPRHNSSTQHNNQHPQPTEVVRGHDSHAHAHAVSRQGDQDLEHGPTSESIPNNSQRPHPPRPVTAIQDKQRSEIETIKLTAPDEMIPTTATTTTARVLPSYSEADISVTQAKLTVLALAASSKDDPEGVLLPQQPIQSQQHRQEMEHERIPKDAANVGKKESATSQQHAPELVIQNSSAPLALITAPATVVTPTHPQHPHPVTSPKQQPSERLTRLLNPSLSTTSLPSLSRTTSRPVVAIVSPNADSSTDHGATSNQKDLSALQDHLHHHHQHQQQQQQQQPPTSSSSAVDLVSKLLNPVVTLGRSRSQTSLQSIFTGGAGVGSPSAGVGGASSQQQQRRHHARHGSGTSLTGSVRSNPGIISSMGFMASPPRAGDGSNNYLVSRFITPVSSQGSLSSSAPKQQSAMSASSNSGAGSLANRRRLPASLRMTSSDMAAGSPDVPAASAAACASAGVIPTSPSATSTYSSSEGPFTSTTNTHASLPYQGNSFAAAANAAAAASPWNPAEALSRTQQKLLLQRDSSHDDLDEQEMARRGRMHRDMERIQREYRCIRMTADPAMESMSRCLALQRRQRQDESLRLRAVEHQHQQHQPYHLL